MTSSNATYMPISTLPVYRRVRLLNIDVADVTMDELLASYRDGLLATLNVDMIVKLQKDRAFYEVLQQYDIIPCDSQILFKAAQLLGTPLRGRVSGSDFFPRFYMRHRNDPGFTVFICGGAPGVAELAQSNINSKVGRNMVIGIDSPPLDFDTRPGEVDRIVAKINASGASVLLVGLRSGRQEKFLYENRKRFEHVRAFLPLGGTIDYEAGTLKRPAPWVTNMGLEWLYRLLRQPRQRWRRYILQQPPVLYYLTLQRLGLYNNPFRTS